MPGGGGAWRKINIPICGESNHTREGIRVFPNVGGIPLCLVWISLLFASNWDLAEDEKHTMVMGRDMDRRERDGNAARATSFLH